MDTDITDAVTDWQTVPASDGYAGLHELAEEAFTGAVTAGLAWAFVLNGRVVGVFDGSIEDFEDAALTAHRAPEPALALLYAMQETGGTVRAQYYTQDTPVSEADRTLSAGSFTGYLELSENVLSGDYYVVYYGGRAMPIAHVGASNRLVTGDEAFELADDEVGIYEVREVSVGVIDIPDPPGASGGVATRPDDETDATTASPFDDEVGATTDTTDGEEATEAGDDGNEPTSVTFGASEDGTTAADDEEAAGGDSAVGTEPPLAGMDVVGDDGPTGQDEMSADEEHEPDDVAVDSPDESEAESDGEESEAESDGEESDEVAIGQADDDEDDEDDDVDHAAADETEDNAGVGVAGADEAVESGGYGHRDDELSLDGTEVSPEAGVEDGAAADPDALSESEPSDADAGDHRERLEAMRAELEAVTAERDDLRDRVDTLNGEVEQLTGQRDEQRERIDELEAEIRTLREEVGRLESQSVDDGDDVPERLSAAAAKEGTNLFVRYRSKGKPTLEKAQAGEAEQEAVVENLRLEYHTTFESDRVTVDGQPYERFLESTVEWGFVRWLVEDLLYEIGRSGNRNDLAELFDRIPEVDRVQFGGEVPVTIEEGTETRHDAERFDLVFWDSMGDPLFVANFNIGRSATTQSMVSSLIEGARRIGESKGTLGAAFFVTASFYEPGALEAVSEATGGGFLSRSSRKSYVKLSRKQGYHLCLVEARSEEFHLSVPEL